MNFHYLLKNNCKKLFSTKFHRILEEMYSLEKTKFFSSIKFFIMDLKSILIISDQIINL
jgi:hypothetical protein